MPTDRLFRQTISGTMFFLGALFWFYVLGGSFESNLVSENKEGLLALLGFLLSTPVVGLIITTITFSILYLRWIRRYVHYYVPTNIELVEKILLEFEGQTDITDPNSKNWKIGQVDKFYPFYQTMVRKFIKDEALEYLERKWASFWTHCNMVAAILISLLFVISFIPNVPTSTGDCSRQKWIAVVVALVYIGLSVFHAIRVRQDGVEFEHTFLLKAMKDNEATPKTKASEVPSES